MSDRATRLTTVYKAAAIAPKKYEIEEIVALLESDQFADSKAAARKVMATALALLTERNWYVVASRLDGDHTAPVQIYGLFATEGAALKALEANTLGLFGRAGVFEVTGLSGRQEQLEAHEDALARGCHSCGHIEAGHDWPRSRRKGCAVGNCRCRTYVRPPRDMRVIQPF